MHPILDHHVPREIVDSIFPESDVPRLEVEDLGTGSSSAHWPTSPGVRLGLKAESRPT